MIGLVPTERTCPPYQPELAEHLSLENIDAAYTQLLNEFRGTHWQHTIRGWHRIEYALADPAISELNTETIAPHFQRPGRWPYHDLRFYRELRLGSLQLELFAQRKKYGTPGPHTEPALRRGLGALMAEVGAWEQHINYKYTLLGQLVAYYVLSGFPLYYPSPREKYFPYLINTSAQQQTRVPVSVHLREKRFRKVNEPRRLSIGHAVADALAGRTLALTEYKSVDTRAQIVTVSQLLARKERGESLVPQEAQIVTNLGAAIRLNVRGMLVARSPQFRPSAADPAG